ncbi:hypothetical protein MMC26_003591 [Xylographa opegraphella]|nr:hypothetical protein [Xylographa opegraphella]
MTSVPTNDALSKDAMFIFQVFKFSEGKPKINWAKVAEATNLKNAKVASTRYSQIVKKHGLSSGKAESESSTPNASTTKSNKRMTTATPGSRTKRARKDSNVAKVASNVDADENAKKCAKVKADDNHEVENAADYELEENDTLLNSESDPLYQRKEGMDNEATAAAAQDYKS